MKVGDGVYLYKNSNLRYKFDPCKRKYSSALKDPDKGIVHKKLQGFVHRILKETEFLTEKDIEKYCNGNITMKRSFETANQTGGVRIVVEFPESTVGRYRLLTEHKYLRADSNSLMGYARVVPNSIRFITEE